MTVRQGENRTCPRLLVLQSKLTKVHPFTVGENRGQLIQIFNLFLLIPDLVL